MFYVAPVDKNGWTDVSSNGSDNFTYLPVSTNSDVT